MDEEEWRRRAIRLSGRVQGLERDLAQAETKLSAAEFRIREELEPRIQAEGRRYDSWATSPERAR